MTTVQSHLAKNIKKWNKNEIFKKYFWRENSAL